MKGAPNCKHMDQAPVLPVPPAERDSPPCVRRLHPSHQRRILGAAAVLLLSPLLAAGWPGEGDKGVVEAGRKGQGVGLRLSLLLAALVTIALLTGACGLIGGGQKPVIKLHDAEFKSIWINNAIAEFIIEKGYGYSVEMVVETTQGMQEAIQKGEIDLRMEGWQQKIGRAHV